MFRKNALVLCAAAATMSVGTAANALTLTNPGAISDSGTVAPIATTAQHAIGNGSWQAPGNNGPAYNKQSLILTPTALGFTSPLKVSDLTSLSWETYKTAPTPSPTADVNWYLTIYTAPTGAHDAGSWYHNRITWEGLYANNYSDPTGQWVTWSTASGANQITFYDSAYAGTNGGFYNGPTLGNLTAGAIDWGNYSTSGSTVTRDYSNDTIQGFRLETGSGWADAYDGYVDNLQIGTTQGDIQVNLDVVPVPATLPAGLALLGLCGVGLVIHRRRRAA